MYKYQCPAGRRKNVPVSSQPIAGILSASSEWNLRYNELIDYRNEHGDLLVPELYNDNVKLGKWVQRQRKRKKVYDDIKDNKVPRSNLKPLSEEEIAKLDQVGFVWQVRDRKRKSDWV